MKRVELATHNDPIKPEKIKVIEVDGLRFWDEEEYHEWKDKFEETKIKGGKLWRKSV